MDAKDQLKVINAGFTIIRSQEFPTLRIKHKDKDHHEWTTLEKDFPSIRQRDIRMQVLLLKPNYIAD